MKIGELPHREFSYCFLSGSPKCEASDTPTGVCVVYYPTCLSVRQDIPRQGFALCIIDMPEWVARYTPTGVLFR